MDKICFSHTVQNRFLLSPTCQKIPKKKPMAENVLCTAMFYSYILKMTASKIIFSNQNRWSVENQPYARSVLEHLCQYSFFGKRVLLPVLLIVNTQAKSAPTKTLFCQYSFYSRSFCQFQNFAKNHILKWYYYTGKSFHIDLAIDKLYPARQNYLSWWTVCITYKKPLYFMGRNVSEKIGCRMSC